MAGPNLPINIDTTYADSGTDTTVKSHQQHHDAIHGVVNAFDTSLKTAVLGDILTWNGSAYNSTKSFGLNVKTLGAVGDDTFRQVNDATYGIIGTGKRFATLTAAQGTVAAGGTGIADLALTDSLDWAAHQWGINILEGGGGGTLLTPRGRYRHNRTLTFPDGWTSQTDTLRNRSVSWAGEGPLSVIKMTVDLGAGKYAVTNRNRGENGGTANKSIGVYRDLRLIGPNEGALVRGTSPCSMDGWGIGAARACYDLQSEYFHSAFDIVGDHGTCINLNGTNSYYGLFLGWSSNLYGDWTMINCDFGNLAYAGIAIHGDSAVTSGFRFFKGGIYTSPYGIVKLSGTSPIGFDDSSFDQFMFEAMGNGAITDYSSIAGNAPVAEYRTTDFIKCAFDLSLPADDGITAHGQYAPINIGKAFRVQFQTIKHSLGFVPGSRALFDIAEFDGCVFEGDIEAWTTDATAAGKPVFFTRAGAQQNTARWFNFSGGFSGWTGEGVIAYSDGAITGKGYGVKYQTDRVVMATSTNISTGSFAGIALEPTAGAGSLLLVATRGMQVPAVLDSGTPAGRFVTLGATAGAFTGAAATSANTVGWLMGNSTTSGRVELRGMKA